MIGVRSRTQFSPKRVLTSRDRAERRFLFKAGSRVRLEAQESLKTSKLPAPKGRPPHTRRGRRLRRAILFGVDFTRRNVVIGTSAEIVGTAGGAHEHGEEYMGRDYPERPFMGPALSRVGPELPDIWKDSIIKYS